MKQRITPEQILELNEEQRGKLQELWKPEIGNMAIDLLQGEERFIFSIDCNGTLFNMSTGFEFCKHEALPLLNIGQMVEILDEKYDTKLKIYKEHTNPLNPDAKFWFALHPEEGFGNHELCDALWAEVKKIL